VRIQRRINPFSAGCQGPVDGRRLRLSTEEQDPNTLRPPKCSWLALQRWLIRNYISVRLRMNVRQVLNLLMHFTAPTDSRKGGWAFNRGRWVHFMVRQRTGHRTELTDFINNKAGASGENLNAFQA